MARTPSSSTRQQIKKLLSNYTDRIVSIINRDAVPSDQSADLKARIIAALGKAGLFPGKRGPGRPPGPKNAKKVTRRVAAAKRKRRPQTPAQQKANQLQGKYMGTIRLLSAAAKARIKALRKKDGVVAAIKLAQQLGKAA